MNYDRLMFATVAALALMICPLGANSGAQAKDQPLFDLLDFGGQGLPADTVFGSYFATLNDSGQLAISTHQLASPTLDAERHTAIWLGDGHGLNIAYQTGVAPASNPELNFTNLLNVGLTGQGALVFEGIGVDNTQPIRAMFREEAGVLTPTILFDHFPVEATPVTPTPTGVITEARLVLHNSQGESVFTAVIDIVGNVDSLAKRGLFSTLNGEAETIAYARITPAPGPANPDSRFGSLRHNFDDFGEIAINNNGVAVFKDQGFWGPVADPNERLNSEVGIWKYSANGTVNIVLDKQNPPPGLVPPSRGISPFSRAKVSINDRNHLIFSGGYDDGGVHTGVWTDRAGSIQPLAIQGWQAPGLPADVTFQSISRYGVYINANDKVAFNAKVESTGPTVIGSDNDQALWTDITGTLQPVFREGAATPGLGGQQFSGVWNMAMNGLDQIVATVNIRPDASSSSATSVWVTGPRGQTMVVAKAGDTVGGRVIALANRDLLYSTYAPGSGGQDNIAHNFNDLGQVLYSALFAGESESEVVLYTPDLHIRTDQSFAEWSDRYNWTLSTPPGHVHDVFVDPAAPLMLLGPTESTAVENLTLDGADGQTTFSVPTVNALHILDTLTVLPGVTLDLSNIDLGGVNALLTLPLPIMTYGARVGDFDSILTPQVGGEETQAYFSDGALMLGFGSAIPEPGSLAILVMGGLMLRRRGGGTKPNCRIYSS